ncbi:MAG: response regulator [Deltaproteobacteria bacterium]|nr:response regulator [Deltaproteobacteria bacterium]
MNTTNAPVRVLVVDDSPTIRRVVGAVLQRAGHEVTTSESGERGLADAESFAPDIILLDFIMPGMNGYQFLQRLAERGDADGVPVVLMCTRGDQAPTDDGALRAAGVVDTITKPFSPEALLAVVHHSLDKRGRRTTGRDATRIVAALASMPAVDDALPDDFFPPAGADGDDERTVKVPVAVVHSVATTGPGGSWPTLDNQPSFALPAGVALCGDLTVIALPEVLQLLKFQGQTGLLLVDAAGLRFDVGIENGGVVALCARDPDGGPARRGDLLLGRYFIAAGLLDAGELDRHLGGPSDGRPIGERLIAAGVITQEEQRRALGEQAQDLMVELLRARRGVFALSPGADKLPSSVVRPGWSVDGLMFEALRQIDEWGVIESEVPSFEARFAIRGNTIDDSGLSAEESAVLRALAVGPLVVRDLVKRSPLRPFDVCRMLYRLAVLKRVRRLDDGDSSKLVSDESGLPHVPLLSTAPKEAS